jgi:uncharacterized protein (DUF58 family)
VIPTPRLIRMLMVWGVIGLAASFRENLIPAWQGAGLLLFIATAVDTVRAYRLPLPHLKRVVPPSLPVSSWSRVILNVEWPGQERQLLKIFDLHPESAHSLLIPCAMELPPGGKATAEYKLRPTVRGEFEFRQAQVIMPSPWGLWDRSRRVDVPGTIRVLPDFRPVTRYALLAIDNRTSQLGVRLRPKRGQGTELHHLREYRIGDALTQIDWKATSRRRRLISREYQDEKNQQIIFLLDCGRAMRAVDQGESHFDHALRSMLLLTYVAQRQQDAVGLLTFGGSDRWLRPTKGRLTMKAMLDAIHDLETTTEASDYVQAATRLMGLQRRRSLVVVISNLKDEGGLEIASAARLMGRRHLVLLASLRESILDTTLEKPIQTFDDARRHGAVQHYMAGRRRSQEALRGRGLRMCDVVPADLPITLVNRYLDIKRTGAL